MQIRHTFKIHRHSYRYIILAVKLDRDADSSIDMPIRQIDKQTDIHTHRYTNS